MNGRKRSAPRWIYFIQSGHSGLVKIGISRDADQRFRTHQAETGDPLTLLGKVLGDDRLEAAIHLAFRHCQVRREWFRPEPELLLYIERRLLALAPEPPGPDSEDEDKPPLHHQRRGQPWEEWEDRMLLDDHLTCRAIADQIRRTPHSIQERRRWLKAQRAMQRRLMS